MKKYTLKLLVALLFCAQTVFAQEIGDVTGSVKGPDGIPQEGVHIFLIQPGFGVSTKADGSFELQEIPVGEYILAVSKVGFSEQRIQLTIVSGSNILPDIILVPSTYHLDEVAVYGQKRETIHAIRLNAPLEQTPLSVNIISKEVLTQQQAISLEDALKNVSGVSKFGSYGLSDNINIRGFDIGLAGGPENYRVNGVMLRTPYSDYIDQVQVLKGPASILYGDVEPGGIINYVTKKPLGYDHASIELKLGEYGLFRPSMDIGGRVTDQVSYRLNTVFENSDSFRDEVSNKQFMIAPGISWKASKNTQMDIEALFMENEVTLDWGMPLGLPLSQAEQLDESNFYGYPDGTSKGSNSMVTATLNHRFSNSWQLRNVSSYSSQPRILHDVYPVYNSANDSVDFSWGDYKERSQTKTFSNFLNVSGEITTGSINHKLLAGIDISYTSRPVAYNFTWPVPFSTSLENPEWENLALSTAPALNTDELPFTQRIGVNVQDLVSLLDDKLHVLIGGRFSQFTDGTKYTGDAEEPADYSDEKESKFSPRIGFTYEMIDGTSLYGSYAESFSSITPDPGRGLTNPKPLLGDQIEFGVKQSLLNERLGITFSYFDLNRKNVLQFDIIDQNGSITDPDNFRANQSGEHNSRGMEFDLNGKLSRNWQLLTALSYFKTEVISEVVQSGNSEPTDYAGKELPNNPNTKLSVWSYYTFEQFIPGMSLGGGFFYQGDMYGDRLNTAANTIDAFSRVDLLLGYEYKHMKFQLNVNNVGNTKTFQRSIFGSYVPQYPRRIIASVIIQL